MPTKRRLRWWLDWGNLPYCIVALACVICATLVWPGHLAWGLLGLAAFSLFVTWRFEFGLE